MALRAAAHGTSFPATPVDDEFMTALAEGLPPSAGIAMGIERLVMLLGGFTAIQSTP
jgi:lysyl-tRNA synthetase class 2